MVIIVTKRAQYRG